MTVRMKSRGTGRAAKLMLVATLLMMIASTAASAGPTVNVLSHEDGGYATTREVTVSGNATAPLNTITFDGEDLAHAEMFSIKWVDGNIVYRPSLVFGDQFDLRLDPDKWTIVRDPQNVSVEAGSLKINYAMPTYPYPPSNMTLVKSRTFDVPEGVNLEARYRMQMGQYGYSGAGGGLSPGPARPWNSHLATLVYYAGPPVTWIRVLGDGRSYYNGTTYDLTWHVYSMSYSADTGKYTLFRDGTNLGTHSMGETPSIFWFGHTDDAGYYPLRPVILVDYAELWATSGVWTSEVFDLGHEADLEGSAIHWNSSHRSQADAKLEVRTSLDNENWTDWVPFSENGSLFSRMDFRYVQLRLRASIPGVLKETAHITVSGIDLFYRDPLVSVEVRKQGDDWVDAEGLYEWQVVLTLAEGMNTIEVRATDSAGAVDTKALDILVDTVAPVGTMEIVDGDHYTNEVNVTLLMDATDRYGVTWVDVSNMADFSQKLRYPYAESLPWRLSGVQGENVVYVRFIDAHGLMSQVLSDSVHFDSFPPLGTIKIDGGAQYTSDLDVRLDLTYSDNLDVALVEVSNRADFHDVHVVPDGETRLTGWKLLEGGDGVRTVHMRVTDVAGNVITTYDDIELYLPKEVGTVAIDGGAELTGQTVVSVDIDMSLAMWGQVRLMQISNSPGFEGARWEAVEKHVAWIIEDGDGIKTVYVRFTDNRDTVTLPINDTIRLDTTPPTVNVTLNGGRPYTTEVDVVGAVTFEDASGIVQMWISAEDSFDRVRPQDPAGTFQWTIPARESDHWVYVRLEDEAGNMGVGGDMVHFATIRPYISLSLPDGDVIPLLPTIAVEVTPIDPYGGIQVQSAFDRDPSMDSPWIPLVGRVNVAVPVNADDGEHTVRVRARNAAGLISDVASIDVTVDTVAPDLAILRPRDGATLLKDGPRVRLEIDVADGNRIRLLSYAVDGGEHQEIPKNTKVANITFDDFGDHTIEVLAEDAAGNVATSETSFKLADASAVEPPRPWGLIIAVVLAVVVAAAVVGYVYNRNYMPGLRSVSLEDGDGWEEEWDHPHLSREEDEKVPPSRLPVVADTPLAKVTARTAVHETPSGKKVELEQLDLPDELRLKEEGTASSDNEWQEF